MQENTHHASPSSAPEALHRAALKLFAAKGFEAVSVKELADEAKVNVSLVSYHFNGKEGLYRYCIEKFGTERLAAANRILTNPKSIEDFQIRLQLFIEEMFIFWLESPEVCQIVQRECDSHFPKLEDVFRNTFMKAFERLVDFLRGAQDASLIDASFDPLIVSGMIHGFIMHTMRSNHLGEKYFGLTMKDPNYRGKVIANIMNLSLNGLRRSDALAK